MRRKGGQPWRRIAELEVGVERLAARALTRQEARIRALSDEELDAEIRRLNEQLVQSRALIRTEGGYAVAPQVPAGADRDLLEEALRVMARRGGDATPSEKQP